jgi:UDP-N-acetylglucosamine 1-carboxyvinyltransferase
VTLRNVPDLSDVRYMAEILGHQGATVANPEPGVWTIRAGQVAHRTPYDLVRKMRASVCLLGSLVGRLRQAEMAIPGGCVIGPRPIDLHLKGLEALGCAVSVEAGLRQVDASRARGATVNMGGPMGSTVLGTANLVMAATLTPGVTRIECAAREPEVVDLCAMLVKMGAKIRGQGTGVIEVEGVAALQGCDHAVIADRIEAGTYLVAGAITGGDVTVTHCDPSHLTTFLDKLREAGVGVETGPGFIRAHGRADARGRDRHRALPGLPDRPAGAVHGPSCSSSTAAARSRRRSILPASSHAAELQRMGADIAIEGATATVAGAQVARAARR